MLLTVTFRERSSCLFSTDHFPTVSTYQPPEQHSSFCILPTKSPLSTANCSLTSPLTLFFPQHLQAGKKTRSKHFTGIFCNKPAFLQSWNFPARLWLEYVYLIHLHFKTFIGIVLIFLVRLNICWLTRSAEWIPCSALLTHMAFALPS